MKQQKENQYGDFLDNLLGDSTAESTPKEPQQGKSKEKIMETLEPETQEMLKQREIRKAVQAEETRRRQPRRYKHYVRTTMILPPETLAKLKEIAFREKALLKEVAIQAFEQAIAQYESKHGEITPSEKPSITEIFK